MPERDARRAASRWTTLHVGDHIGAGAGDVQHGSQLGEQRRDIVQIVAVYSEIDVRALNGLGASARVIDVREPDEWAAGHIANAVHVPLGTVPERTEAFDGSPTYVICRSGGRSGRACEYLTAQGRDVVNVAGGMLAWAEAGFDIEVGPSK